MTDVHPSGEQIEIRAGDYRAVAVTVGGGLRELSYGGRALLDGYSVDAIADGGRGQALAPWPNRLRDGRWTLEGEELQLPVSEPGQGNAIHGLVRWVNWAVEARDDRRVVLGYRLAAQPGYPFTVHFTAEYAVDGDSGLTATLTARTLGSRAAHVALGIHPYLRAGTEFVDECSLHIPARTFLVTDDRGIPIATKPVDGTAYDFRDPHTIGDTVVDTCYTDLLPSDDGRTTVRLAAPDGTATELWTEDPAAWIQVYTGDTLEHSRRRQGLAVEPMTAPGNALATGEGVAVVEPGDSLAMVWGVSAA